MAPLEGLQIAIMATHGVERVELTEPKAALEAAGARCVLVSTTPGIDLFDHLDRAGSLRSDLRVSDATVDDYDGLLLPGGVANPDALRRDADAVEFVRGFITAGKPVAAICHAPWLLVEADVVRGRALTSWPSLRVDIVNAGGRWTDAAVVRDGRLVTSRQPDDLPQFIEATIDTFAAPAAIDDELDAQLDDSFPASDPPSLTAGPKTTS